MCGAGFARCAEQARVSGAVADSNRGAVLMQAQSGSVHSNLGAMPNAVAASPIGTNPTER